MPEVEPIRNVADVLTEVKREIESFLKTRLCMFQEELRENWQSWKMAAPLLLCGAGLLGISFLVLTAALIAIIAFAFHPNPLAYFFAFVIVGVAYALAGAVSAAFACRQLKEKNLFPKRTLQVLKEDAAWLEKETDLGNAA